MQLIYLLLLMTLIQCTLNSENNQHEIITANETGKVPIESTLSRPRNIATDLYKPLEINCDSIYLGENITIQLWTPESRYYYDGPNSEFVFIKDSKIIYRDSVFSSAQLFEFEDYNSDGIKDILIQQYSDVRSNWTYNLYLIQPKTYLPEHIDEFSQIKNPNLNFTRDTIYSYVISGEIYLMKYLFTDSKKVVQIGETIITGDPQ